MGHPPATAESRFLDGVRLIQEGSLGDAEQAFREALRLSPSIAEIHANLAFVLERTGRPAEAEICYRRALTLDPAQVQAHLNFGALLNGQRRFAEGEAIYRKALMLAPENPALWSNLGVLLANGKRETEAEQCYRTAMALDPDYGKAPFNLAYLLLRQGRYEEGWQRFEARDWYRPLEKLLDLPRWRGEDLNGKALLIGVEAGHGDMIQFCRYAPLLKARGATHVGVLCHPALQTLFGTLDGVDEAIALNTESEPRHWDCWTPPMSLPYLFGTRLDSIPAALPYLSATPEKLHRWASELPPVDDALRVGLVWKGNPRFENDAERSLPSLDLLAPLGDIPGVRYVSLQKGAGEDEAKLPPAPLALTELGSRLTDFADTAAIVSQLDLVISVDSAVAHLAGALGKRCWVLLPDYLTDWRWLAEREDSPWYPGVVRLFRQGRGGGWPPVIGRLKAALQTLAEENKKGD